MRGHIFSLLLGTYLRVELLGYIILCLSFGGTIKLLPTDFERLLCARHCAECFTCIKSLCPHDKAMKMGPTEEF